MLEISMHLLYCLDPPVVGIVAALLTRHLVFYIRFVLCLCWVRWPRHDTKAIPITSRSPWLTLRSKGICCSGSYVRDSRMQRHRRKCNWGWMLFRRMSCLSCQGRTIYCGIRHVCCWTLASGRICEMHSCWLLVRGLALASCCDCARSQDLQILHWCPKPCRDTLLALVLYWIAC